MQVDYRNKDIIWTASDYDTSIAMTEFPYIELIEYKQSASQIRSQYEYWERRVKNAISGGGNPYSKLYIGDVTTNEYILPFFTETHHQIGQNWQENQAPLGDTIKRLTNAAEAVGKALYPAAGIMYPKSYAGANEYLYDITFYLINTISDEGTRRNKEFLETFIAQNLHVQENSLAITPPSLYTAFVPGVRWSPVCVVSNLSISNKGTLNRNADGHIVPDAWEVRIQLRELINESRMIYQSGMLSKGGNTPREGGTGQVTVKVIEGA